MLWQSKLSTGEGASIVVGQNEIYVLGAIKQAAPNTNRYDGFVLKLDKSNGKVIWSKGITDAVASSERVNSGVIDDEGNLHVIGTYWDTYNMYAKVSQSGTITVKRITERSAAGNWGDPVIRGSKLYFMSNAVISGSEVSSIHYIDLVSNAVKSATVSRVTGATAALRVYGFAMGKTSGDLHFVGAGGYNGAVGIHHVTVLPDFTGYGSIPGYGIWNTYLYYNNTTYSSIPGGANIVLSNSGVPYIITTLATTSGSINYKSIHVLTPDETDPYRKFKQIGAFFVGSSNITYINSLIVDNYIYILGVDALGTGAYLFKFDCVSKTLTYAKKALFEGTDIKFSMIRYDDGKFYIAFRTATNLYISAFESEETMLSNMEGLQFSEPPARTLQLGQMSETYNALAGVATAPSSVILPSYRIYDNPVSYVYADDYVKKRICGFICGG